MTLWSPLGALLDRVDGVTNRGPLSIFLFYMESESDIFQNNFNIKRRLLPQEKCRAEIG